MAEHMNLVHVINDIPSDPEMIIADREIDEVRISGLRPLILRSCFIRRVKLENDARLALQDCYVQRISIGRRHFEDFELRGGALFGFDGYPQAASPNNAFQGRVTVRDVFLPRRVEHLDGSIDIPDLPARRARLMYEWRNVRMYLTKKGDLVDAGIFHGAELALERDDETTRTGWWLNRLYEIFSDYGNSVTRPLGWALASYAVLALALMAADVWLDLKPIQAASGSELVGWQQHLSLSPWWRAFAYPLYAIFNPLNLFTAKPLMATTEIWWTIPFSVVALVGSGSVFLAVLAIRRRFKLEKSE